MNAAYDLEQLRRKIGSIEIDLDDARKQLAVLAAQIETGEAPPPAPEAEVTQEFRLPAEPAPARAIPPPLPAEAFKIPEAEPVPVTASEPWPGIERFAQATREPEAEPDVATPAWKGWLQRLQLWPPDDGQNKEVRLGAWWATRLGTLMAVIGVVFFGVYVSLNTPPWVKFIELCAICGGVAMLGLWLEKRMERFGAVVLAGGLALVYFCAFAGYALPAVKVLSNPAAAVGWQLAAVLLIAGASVSRRSALIATMAIGLGYVTAIFSRAGGLHDFALVTAALLAITAVGFYRWLRWEAPSVLALPGAYAVYAMVLQKNWLSADASLSWQPWLFLGGIVTLFYLRDWRLVRVTHDQVSAGERWFQGTNSSLAVALGVVTALTLYHGGLAEFYFGAAALLGLFSAMRRAQVEGDAVGAVLLAKATGAFTLGVIEVVDGRTTALALLVQAWVMLFSARRLKSGVLAAGTALVAMVAAFYFFRDAMSAVALVSWQAAGALAFVAGFAWLASEGRRAISTKGFDGALTMEVAGALVATTGAVVSVLHLQPGGWAPALLVGFAAVLGLPALRRRSLAPLAAAGMLMTVANVSLWQLVGSSPEHGRLIINAMVVLLPGVMVGACFGNRWFVKTLATEMAAVGAGIWAVTILGFAHVVFALNAPVAALGVMIILAAGLGAVAPIWRDRHLPWLATLSGVLGVFFWREAGAGVESGGWLIVALIGAWALPVGFHGSRRHRAVLKAEPGSAWATAAQMAVALWVTLEALPFYFSGTGQVLACAVISLAVFGLTHRPGIRAGLESSWVLWATAIWATARMSLHGQTEFSDDTLRLVAVALLAWVPAVVISFQSGPRLEAGAGPWWRRRASDVQTIIATILAVLVSVGCFRGADLSITLVVAMAVSVAMFRLGRVDAARASSVALAVCALWAAWAQAGSGGADGWGSGMASVLLTTGALILMPLVIAGGSLSAGQLRRLQWGFGTGALGLAFFTALAQQGALDPYATVGWGLASITVFMTGLFARVQPYRMLGLAGLALCVSRVFLVDLDSALHRIVAFVVLGLVLLWVGFSYHRFRHLITDEHRDDKSP